MSNEKKIIVIAGDRSQFQYWLRHNIIPITSKHDIAKLRGIEIEKVYFEGTYYSWLDRECDELIHRIDGHL